MARIDILSDLHLDAYFPHTPKVKKEAVKDIFDPIFLVNRTSVGDVLIIAGDIGHYNEQNIEILRIFRQEYYQNIVCVLGNHDYYLNSKDEQEKYQKSSFARVEEMRALINAEEGMYCLNGAVVEIDGIRFGGVDSSYNNAYLKVYFPISDNPRSNNEYWKMNMPDHKMMFGIKKYNQLYKLSLPLLEAVYKDCDVMITHVNPSFLHQHLSPSWQNNRSSMFYSFDGHRFLEGGSMKYWLFGHTHNRLEYEHYGVTCICNPLGYPPEEDYNKMAVTLRSIEL
ncbi:metallophosphoesterase family protein [Sulfurospirillum multivorans]|uniref:Metallophosphoesterase n=2 Tax=Sulfurospirillum multivorans TaxID=66821 RepID=A0AA86DZG7_SULMK|nr:metallophosphoesterase [Sulfurospirillum multivorans]AHJ14363.1 putative metallophosphoesterase [Sulfurospirillum multivorans DSM 12446]QEH07848.1 putative metallophosphoesterase [Sulfurospirillum multivorans]